MITKKQYPYNLHSVFVPVFYTYNTDLSLTNDFNFKYTLKDVNGDFFYGLTVPLENNLSYNSPNEVLKSKTKFNFNPSIHKISNIPDNCIVYQETIEENISGGTSEKFYVKSAFRYSDTEFNPYDNLLNDDASRNFLVNMPNNHNIRLIDDFTFRTYNGNLDSSGNYSATVYVYKMRIYFDKNKNHTVDSIIVESMPNDYFNADQSKDFYTTSNGDDYGIEIPAGVNNWKNQKFILRGYFSGSTYVDMNQSLIILNVDDDGKIDMNIKNHHIIGYIDNYDYYMYTWPRGDNGRISQIHNFKIIDDCRFESVNVAWENTKGGVDYFIFTKANEKRIESKKDIYNKNLYKLNITDSYVNKNKFNKNKSVYRKNVETIYELNTDWLSQEEINGLEDLFKSTEVYINLNNKWIYVISIDNKIIIYNKKRKGLKKYKLNFLIGEKQNRY